MVVDILETKLDEDHVDYIHNMLLKNASSDATAPNMSTEDVPVITESKVTIRRESTQEPHRNLPENWTEMDRKKVLVHFIFEIYFNISNLKSKSSYFVVKFIFNFYKMEILILVV